jgi:hypothetical protein
VTHHPDPPQEQRDDVRRLDANVGGVVAKLENLIRQTETIVGGQSVIAMHPRRLWWVRERAVVENIASLEFDEPPISGAAVAERQPASLGVLSGTGLAAPA